MHRWNDTRIFHKECKSLSKLYEVVLICFGEDAGVSNVDGITISCI